MLLYHWVPRHTHTHTKTHAHTQRADNVKSPLANEWNTGANGPFPKFNILHATPHHAFYQQCQFKGEVFIWLMHR